MTFTNFHEFDKSELTFLLSTVVGSDKVLTSVLETINNHLNYIEVQVAAYNQGFFVYSKAQRLTIQTSIEIVAKSVSILRAFNGHSCDLLSSESKKIVPDYRLKDIDGRYMKCLETLRKIFDVDEG